MSIGFLWFYCFLFYVFKQKTAYEMRISDWSSDVCSSDLLAGYRPHRARRRRKRHDPLSAERRDADGGRFRWLCRRFPPCRPPLFPPGRSAERREGKVCVRTCRSRWSPDLLNTTNIKHIHTIKRLRSPSSTIPYRIS